METNIVVCVLIGLPGAGKTTLADNLSCKINQFSNSYFNVIKLSFDDFLCLENQEKLVLESQNDSESKVFKEARSMFTQLIINVISSIKTSKVDDQSKPYLKTDPKSNEKYLLVLDDNFYYKSMRYKFFQIASEYNCGFCEIYLQCSETVAKKRNEDRPNKVSSHVIQTMNEKLEPPRPSNSWESQSLCIRSHEMDKSFDSICELIIRNYKNGLSSKPEPDLLKRIEAQNLNLASLLHRADIILRTLVGQKMKSSKQQTMGHSDPKSKLREISSMVNATRIEILEKLRSGIILVPSSVFQGSQINNQELEIMLSNEFDSLILI